MRSVASPTWPRTCSISRVASDQPLRSEPVELEELSRAVGAEFGASAQELDVTLDVSPPPGPCWGHGDPGALAHVLRILLDNRFAAPSASRPPTTATRRPSR